MRATDTVNRRMVWGATGVAGAGVLVRLCSAMVGSPWLTVISDALMILGGGLAALTALVPALRPDGAAPTSQAGAAAALKGATKSDGPARRGKGPEGGGAGLTGLGPFRVDWLLGVFLGVCALSVAVCRPNPAFMAVPKLGLFVLMVAAIGPLVFAEGLCAMRRRLWRLLLWGLRVIVVLSFIVYVVTVIVDVNSSLYDYIPYADRDGITNERIMLSAVSALVAVDALWKATLAGATPRRERLWLVALAAAGVVTMIQAASRMAVIGCVAATLYVAVAHRRYILAQRRALVAGVAGATLILLLTGVFFSESIMMKVGWDMEAGSLFRSRNALWADRLGEFLDHPVLGLGFHAFDRCTLPTVDPRWTPDWGPLEPGSSWLTLLSQTGLVGFATFAAWLVAWLRRQMRAGHGYTIAIAILLLCNGISEGWLTYTGGIIFLCFWLNASAPGEKACNTHN